MIHRTRKFLVWLLGKFIPYQYFIEAANAQKKKNSRLNTTIAQSSTLTESAIIRNLQNRPEKISIGEDSVIRGELLIFRFGGKIVIGNNCYVGENTYIWSGESVVIGNDVLISHQVNICDASVHELNYLERAEGYRRIKGEGHPTEKGTITTAPIIIEDYAWINPYVVILKGVRIGKGAIIGAGSVVVDDVPPFTFVAGNPAKFIKTLPHD